MRIGEIDGVVPAESRMRGPGEYQMAARATEKVKSEE